MKASKIENLMIKVLEENISGLTLRQIISCIREIDNEILQGASPTKSLYSIIYRREKNREKKGIKKLFIIDKSRMDSVYSLNNEEKKNDK